MENTALKCKTLRRGLYSSIVQAVYERSLLTAVFVCLQDYIQPVQNEIDPKIPIEAGSRGSTASGRPYPSRNTVLCHPRSRGNTADFVPITVHNYRGVTTVTFTLAYTRLDSN